MVTLDDKGERVWDYTIVKLFFFVLLRDEVDTQWTRSGYSLKKMARFDIMYVYCNPNRYRYRNKNAVFVQCSNEISKYCFIKKKNKKT